MTYNPAHYTRAELHFDYSEIPARIEEPDFVLYCRRMQPLFASVAKAWSPDANSEWLTRNYLAIKMIFGGSVMLSSLEYASEHNLRVVEPYLRYYGVFNAARAWFLTMPNQEWGDGNRLLAPTHSRVINVVVDEAKHISIPFGTWTEQILRNAKGLRELFSYKFPSEGLDGAATKLTVPADDAVSAARVFCELAQANSEILERSVGKHVAHPVPYSGAFIQNAFTYVLPDGLLAIDRDDKLRIRQMMSPPTHPFNLASTIREGFVDDFFGSWHEGEEGAYNPDENSRIIFPFP